MQKLTIMLNKLYWQFQNHCLAQEWKKKRRREDSPSDRVFKPVVSNAGDAGSIPGWGAIIKISYASWPKI